MNTRDGLLRASRRQLFREGGGLPAVFAGLFRFFQLTAERPLSVGVVDTVDEERSANIT